jgi:hypothetical protein
VEKRSRDRKRKEKEDREKENWTRAREGKSPLATPESMSEPGSSPLAPGEIDYTMLDSPDADVVGDQSPSQRGAGIEPPSPVGGGTHAQTMTERTPALADAGTLGQVFLPRPLATPSAPPVGHTVGAGTGFQVQLEEA